MDTESSDIIDRYLLEFEDNAEQYEHDIEFFIAQRNVDAQSAKKLRETLRLGQGIDLLAGSEFKNGQTRQCADSLTKDFGGEYRFIRELGRGGMGTVWLADQLTPDRRVAIKLIRAGLETKNIQQRFESEQQSLAMMSHPGIAKGFFSGTLDYRRPYFVMEYVDGISITEYCNRNRLALNKRLDLFLQLCNAIEHAHQKGVIHRDIKPNNILVVDIDGQPHIKVIDFGLAKATANDSDNDNSRLELTDANVALGSPLWMSPEQTQWDANGQKSIVDTRSDVYSLGVILYQLLTNTTPIDGTSFQESDRTRLFDAIRNKVPPYPSRRLADSQETSWLKDLSTSDVSNWASTLRDDLDWITMKTLEKEPDRRYAGVSALADDLRRFTIGQPVVARPPSTAYQLKKYIGRNKGVAVATTIAVIALTAGSALSTLYAFRANQTRKIAEQERQVADRERNSAEKLVAFFSNEIKQFNIFATDTKFNAFKKERLIHLGSEIEKLNLDEMPKHEIQLRMPLAQSLKSIGARNLAKTEFEKILKLAESQLGESDSVTMDVRNKLALVYLSTGDRAAAKALLLHTESLLSNDKTQNTVVKLECQFGLAGLKFSHSEIRLAISDYQSIVEQCKKEWPDGHPLTIEALFKLGEAYYETAKFEKADRAFTDANLLSDRHFGPDSTKSLELDIALWVNRGDWQSPTYNPQKDLEFLDKVAKKLGVGNQKAILLRCKIAESLVRNRSYELALESLNNGIAACENVKNDRAYELGNLWFRKIETLNMSQQFVRATEFYDEISSDLATGNDLFINIQYQAVKALLGAGDRTRAREFIEKYEPMALEIEGENGIILNNLRKTNAQILQGAGDYQDAVSVLEKVRQARIANHGDVSRDAGMAAYELGLALNLAGQPDKALELFVDANEIVSQVFPYSRPNRLYTELELMQHYAYAGEFEESFDTGKTLLSNISPNKSIKGLNLFRFKAQTCQAESAGRLGKVDVAKAILKKMEPDLMKFKYLRESSVADRIDLIKGVCSIVEEDYDQAERLLLRSLKKLKARSGYDNRKEYIENTLAMRRIANQLVDLYTRWDKPNEAQKNRDLKFEFER